MDAAGQLAQFDQGVLGVAVRGADPTRGSGLSGLAQRVAVVDGRLDIASPPGGPTRITVELPLRAGGR